MSINLQIGASPMAAVIRTPVLGQIGKFQVYPNSIRIGNYGTAMIPIRLASTRPKINSFTCFAVPKKRTSASKKQIRKNVWKMKGDTAALKAFSLGKSLSTGNSKSFMGTLPQPITLTPELKTTLDKVVNSQKIVLFMKGTKDFPQCGFSNTVVQILKSFNVPFETFNILENEMLRVGLKEYSSWPTFPQLYIDGEFFGGCDITVDAYKSGELQELLEKAICS